MELLKSGASQAPYGMGVTAGAIGTLTGIGPQAGALGGMAGEIINQGFNPTGVATKYHGFEKIRPEDLPQFRREKINEIMKVLGTGAVNATLMKLAQAALGTRTLPPQPQQLGVQPRYSNGTYGPKTPIYASDLPPNNSPPTYIRTQYRK